MFLIAHRQEIKAIKIEPYSILFRRNYSFLSIKKKVTPMLTDILWVLETVDFITQ